MPPFFSGDGDNGTTGLLGEGRIPKHHPRVEAIGVLDEAMAALGHARSLNSDPSARAILQGVQRHLYQIMAEVAAPGENAARFRMIGPDQIAWIESEIEARADSVKSPGEFLLGGDTTAGGALDLARTVVRRAERRLSLLIDKGEIENRSLLAYLNRTSSLCFVLILEGYQRENIEATRAREVDSGDRGRATATDSE